MRLLQAFFEASSPRVVFDALLILLVSLGGLLFGLRHAPLIASGRERSIVVLVALLPAAFTVFLSLPDLLDAFLFHSHDTTPLWAVSTLALLLLALLILGPTYRFAVFAVVVVFIAGIGGLGWVSFMMVQALVETVSRIHLRSGESYVVLVVVILVTLLCIAGTLFLIGLGARLIRSLLAPAQEGGAPLSDGSAPPARETGDTESAPEPPPA